MILPAILETNPKKQLQRIEELNRFAKIIHIDVADGKFVKTNNLNAFRSLSRVGAGRDLPLLELHLMAQKPLRLFAQIRKIKNVKRIILQVESEWEPAFRKFKRHYQVGLAFRPETPLYLPFVRGEQTEIVPSLRRRGMKPLRGFHGGGFGVDFIQLLSVTPGAQGNSFHPKVYRRVKELKRLFPKMRIEIDGAMNPTRIRKLKALGANDFVVGSYLKEGNVARRAALLREF